MRHKDWEARLNAAIQKHGALPAVWGKSDCWCLMADCYRAVNGSPFLPHLRKYNSEKSGYKLFVKNGFKTVEQALASVLEPKSTLAAMRGDLAVVERNGVISGGVITAYGFTSKGEDGRLFHLPITDVLKVFEVA